MLDCPKILIIPSWYPIREQLSGIFFMQQAALIQQRYDVRVMYGYSPYLEHKSLYGKYHRYKTKERGKTYINKIQDPLPTTRFEYGNWWMGDRASLVCAMIGYQRELRRLIKNGWKPDLIHAQCSDPAGIIAMVIQHKFRIPYILTEHQVFALGNYSKYHAKLIVKAINNADLVTVTSQHQIRSLATNFLYPDLVISPNLIDEEILKPSELNKKNEKFKILTLQWPDKIKDPETFFRAISFMIQHGHQDIDVIIIGKKLFSEDDTSPSRFLAEKYNCLDVCTFCPSVSQEDLVKNYSEADVFVSTSVAETFGLAVREAMAVGKPVVCTASGGVDDDIFEFNGLKVDIHDYKGVAAALIAIKTGAVKYDPLRIREFVVSKYGRQAFIRKMSSIYDAIVQ